MIRLWFISAVAAFGATATFGSAHAAPAANFSGTYRCEPDPRPCSDQTVTVTQTGAKLEAKGNSGTVAEANVTSDISLSMGPPWNMLGVVLPDHAIQWSNGTKWRKQ